MHKNGLIAHEMLWGQGHHTSRSMSNKLSTRSTVANSPSVDLVAVGKTAGLGDWSIVVHGFKGGHEVTGEVGEESFNVAGGLGACLDVHHAGSGCQRTRFLQRHLAVVLQVTLVPHKNLLGLPTNRS